MSKQRDKHPATPEGDPKRDHPPRSVEPPASGKSGLTPANLPPFPSPSNSFGSDIPAGAVPDFSIPPFADLPPFPSFSPEERPHPHPPSQSVDPEPAEPDPEVLPVASELSTELNLPPLPDFTGFIDESATPPPSPQSAPPPEELPEKNLPPAFQSADLLPLPIETAETTAPPPASPQLRRHLVLPVAALLLFGLVLLSWMIKLPNVVTAPVIVSGLTSSAPVIPRRDGTLSKLLVEEKQPVVRDQILALIENSANADDILRLAGQLETLRPFLNDEGEFAHIDFDTKNIFGELTSEYSAFQNDYNRYRATLEDNYTEETAASHEMQRDGNREKIDLLREQAEALEREVELAAQKYERMKSLFQRRTVSVAELQEQERAFLTLKRLNSSLAQNLVEESMALTKSERDTRDLRRQRDEVLRTSRESLRDSLRNLVQAVANWEADYILRAPEAGIIVFYDYWREHRQVRKGREAFLIIPENSPLIGQIRLDKEHAGKIEDGQEVEIRLDGYPQDEFGVVPGTVESISAVPLNDAYLVSVKLEYPLVTSQGRALTFRREMAGEASIVTDEVRLIGRIFSEIRKALIDPTTS